MITINLLPAEYRTKQRPALVTVSVVACVVAGNAILAAWWAWTAFGTAAEVKSELAVLEDTMSTLKPQIAYYKALEGESKLFQARENTLEEITSSRISWTRKLDELIDVVDRGGNGPEKYLIWFDDLTVEQEVNTRRNTNGSLTARGNSGSKVFAHVANFLDDIQRSPFSEGFGPPSPPEVTSPTVDPELIPAEVWSFPLALDLLGPPPKEPPKPAKPAEPAPAAKGSEKQ